MYKIGINIGTIAILGLLFCAVWFAICLAAKKPKGPVKKAAASCAAILLVGFAICIISEKESDDVQGPSRAIEPVEELEQQTKPTGTEQTQKKEKAPSPEEVMKADVLSYLQENGIDEPKISILKNRVSIKLYSDYSEENQPEGWEDYIQNKIEISNKISEMCEKNASIELYGIENSILLTVQGGKCKHDAYRGDNNASVEKADVTEPSVFFTTEEFIQAVSEAIEGQVGAGESILGVELDEGNLIVTVDLSGTNSVGLEAADIAAIRASGITDKILEPESFDDMWETITINFVDIGYIAFDKTNIEENELGRYFPIGNMNLQYFDTYENPVLTEESEPTTSTEPPKTQGRTVYKTRTGKRYHYDGSCNGGTYIATTLDDALSLGLTPCEKCVS